MSDTTISIPVKEPSKGVSPPGATHKKWYWRGYLSWPLWVCLLLALTTRIWLTIHTHGVIAGDEAMVGLQAEHILHGERPIYYYSQPYMGSLEAYLIAFIFLFTGPTVWAFRAEPILISLALVYLTWRFSAVLADTASLSPRAKKLFMTIATLIAAFPPLYDMVEEMRAKGGYVEAFTLMLWLLLCAFRLTQRWQAHASAGELALRWAGIGLLIGLGLWVDPLVIYAVAAIALWIGCYLITLLVKGIRSRLIVLKEALLVVAAIPAGLLGFAPGLYWGANNQWANVYYIFHNGGPVPQGRLHAILQVQNLYTTCLVPRVLGGALPTQPDVTLANQHLLTFGLVVSVSCLAVCAVSVALSLFWQHAFLARIRQLIMLPLLFFLCTSIVFCTASVSVVGLVAGCGPWDTAGRYVVPLVVALPFIIAATFSIPLLIAKKSEEKPAQEQEDTGRVSQLPAGMVFSQWRRGRQGFSNGSSYHEMKSLQRRIMPGARVYPSWLAPALLVSLVLALYFIAQGFAYVHADPSYTFQGTGCVAANPTNLDPIISYMQQENIHYAWATGWFGDPITFKTDGAIIATELSGRIAADDDAVRHADRPSILLLVRHADLHPAILKPLDANGVTYRVARFYSEPGVDALVVTPLNRTVSPLDPLFAAMFNKVFSGCL